jgi:hypothetical protein
MAKAKKFPEYLHVTLETTGDGHGTYLQAREDWVNESDIDSNRPFAVYVLQSEGEVKVSRVYVPKKKR